MSRRSKRSRAREDGILEPEVLSPVPVARRNYDGVREYDGELPLTEDEIAAFWQYISAYEAGLLNDDNTARWLWNHVYLWRLGESESALVDARMAFRVALFEHSGFRLALAKASGLIVEDEATGESEVGGQKSDI